MLVFLFAGIGVTGNFEGGYVEQQYLPEERRYYEPVERGYEAEIRARLEEWRAKGDAESAGK